MDLGRRIIEKICKISVEKLFFLPQISYKNLRWNAVNTVKICNFAARVSGEIRKKSPYFTAKLRNFTALVSSEITYLSDAMWRMFVISTHSTQNYILYLRWEKTPTHRLSYIFFRFIALVLQKFITS